MFSVKEGRRNEGKNTEKSCAWSGFFKIGLNLVGKMDFVGSGLGQDRIWFLPPKFSGNAVLFCFLDFTYLFIYLFIYLLAVLGLPLLCVGFL